MFSGFDGGLIGSWINRARPLNRHILLAEGEEPRVLRAAELATKLGLCRLSVLGSRSQIERIAVEQQISLDGIEIIEIANHPLFDALANDYSQMRQRETGKALPPQIAASLISNPLYFGALLASRGVVDGIVAGAVNTTASVLRVARLIIGPRQSDMDISSCFVLDGLPSHLGNDGVIGLADCAVITNPTSSQLANIAIATASTMELLVPGCSPRVALLSFSTHGSSVHSSVDEITRAVALIREKSSLLVDGELQVDAALIPAVAEVKAPESALHGRANILVFPDLNSANIGYKLMQYAGGARSYGPIFQGLRYPMNDLSRGATPAEIVGVIACSCLQSQS
ncbi:MAG: phosphate acyltransferase [Candidatus Sumerlaeales bacterium]|nr:phosphate acyltransferase [Candidatus Sumerlaeales bacterium]